MKAYIVKYALTKGIIEVDGNVVKGNPGMLEVKGYYGYFFQHDTGVDDWCEKKEDAIKIAELMKQNKIESLKKQIKKLEKKKFE